MPTTTATDVMISVDHVTKGYDGRIVLDDISIQVERHEILAVIGPSGCGKSTMLRVMSGLEEPDSGDIHLADDNMTLVFQYSALFDSLTVFENVAFSLLEKPDIKTRSKNKTIQKKYSDEELRLLVHEKLDLVGLGDILDQYPNQLSGGMQKRVSFARAIISNPAIIFYDEPTAGLDPIASTVIENYIDTLRKETNVTSVVVTHNLSTIERVADKVCLLFDGKMQWYGSSREFFTTDNAYARQFAKGSLEGPMTQNPV